MRAALDINLPNYVNASEITEAISARPGSPLIHAGPLLRQARAKAAGKPSAEESTGGHDDY